MLVLCFMRSIQDRGCANVLIARGCVHGDVVDAVQLSMLMLRRGASFSSSKLTFFRIFFKDVVFVLVQLGLSPRTVLVLQLGSFQFTIVVYGTYEHFGR